MQIHYIGIAGKKGSGKDVAYKAINNELRETHTIMRFAFADSLKDEVSFAINKSKAFIELNKSGSLRQLLQAWGSFKRDYESKDYWLIKWKAKVKYFTENFKSESPLVIVTPDVRHINEAEELKAKGAQLWRVVGYGFPGEDFVEPDLHESETSLDSYRGFDLTIINTFNKTQDLITQVRNQLNNTILK